MLYGFMFMTLITLSVFQTVEYSLGLKCVNFICSPNGYSRQLQADEDKKGWGFPNCEVTTENTEAGKQCKPIYPITCRLYTPYPKTEKGTQFKCLKTEGSIPKDKVCKESDECVDQLGNVV